MGVKDAKIYPQLPIFKIENCLPGWVEAEVKLSHLKMEALQIMKHQELYPWGSCKQQRSKERFACSKDT